MHSLGDVALLYFHDENALDVFARDVSNLLRVASKHPYARYVAEFKGVSKGTDSRLYIVEELLARSLDRIGQINDLTKFVRIARDLCRGLAFLHSAGLVHRDLKLDNCGIDHQGRAKIFDLGSVTSDPGSAVGTILTRPPELFRVSDTVAPDEQMNSAADIWAMGATLFALRMGEYPFVHKSEISERRAINLRVANGEMSHGEANDAKKGIDKTVEDRINRPEAESELRERIHHTLRGRGEEILNSMLAFDPQKRETSEMYADSWKLVGQELGGIHATRNREENKWQEVANILGAALRKEISLTQTHVDRVINQIAREKELNGDIDRFKEVEELLREIREQAPVGSMSTKSN